MPTKERPEWINQFQFELKNLNINNSLILEIEKNLTTNIPNIVEFNLYDKCEIRIKELEDEHDTSKKAQNIKNYL